MIQKKKGDGLVIHQKDELVIQVNFWWVGNLQRNFDLWKELISPNSWNFSGLVQDAIFVSIFLSYLN